MSGNNGRYHAGQLDKRITLQAKTVTRASAGDETIVWTDLATVYAMKAPIRGREFFNAEAVQSQVTVKFIIRFRRDVKSHYVRVKEGQGVYYTIDSVIDIDGEHHWLELMCSETF